MHISTIAYFSPVSVHNIMYLQISLIALFLSSFNTQHYVSAHITHRSISLLFQYTTLCICTYHSSLYFSLFQYTTLCICTYHSSLYFSPFSVHNIIYLHISLIALLLSFFSTQHYVSAHIINRSIALLFQYTTLYICTYHP